MIDVLFLAEQDTNLHKESTRERAGACPGYYKGKCTRKQNGFRVRQNDQGQWRFMCRGCWDAADMLPDKGRKRGWGDEIDYLRHFRGMSYQQARAFLESNGDTQPACPAQATRNRWETDAWQQDTLNRLQLWAATLWDAYNPDALAAYGYIRDRGFTDQMLRTALIGYRVVAGVPYLTVPDVYRGHVRAVHCRDLRSERPEHAPSWPLLSGSNPHTLYLEELLQRKMPTILVESPLDALSIAQEAGKLVNVVATGSTTRGRTPENLARLVLQPLVLVAFDADEHGDDAAKWWINRLPGSYRLRPFLKDINAMLADGWDLWAWIEQALAKHAPEQADEIPSDVLVAMQEKSLCMLCDEAGEYEGEYEGEEVMYCEKHHPGRESLVTFVESKILPALPSSCWTIKEVFHVSREEEMKQRVLREMAAQFFKPLRPRVRQK